MQSFLLPLEVKKALDLLDIPADLYLDMRGFDKYDLGEVFESQLDKASTEAEKTKLAAAYKVALEHRFGNKNDLQLSVKAKSDKEAASREAYQNVDREIHQNFDPKTYVAFFEKLTGKTFKYDVVNKYGKGAVATNRGMAYSTAGMAYAFESVDRDFRFRIAIEVDMQALIKYTSTGAPIKKSLFDYMVKAEADIREKHIVFEIAKARASDLGTPSHWFPETKIRSLAKVRQSAPGKASKADFDRFFRSVDAIISNKPSSSLITLPIRDQDSYLSILRKTYSRKGYYIIDSVMTKNAQTSYPPLVPSVHLKSSLGYRTHFLEDAETLALLRKLHQSSTEQVSSILRELKPTESNFTLE